MKSNKETIIMLVFYLLAEITLKPFTNQGQTDPIMVVISPKFNRSN